MREEVTADGVLLAYFTVRASLIVGWTVAY